jgi:hypothetical protein
MASSNRGFIELLRDLPDDQGLLLSSLRRSFAWLLDGWFWTLKGHGKVARLRGRGSAPEHMPEASLSRAAGGGWREIARTLKVAEQVFSISAVIIPE